MNKNELKIQRVAEVNAVIKAISNHGRRFFYYGGSNRIQPDKSVKFVPADRTARFELRNGRLYFIDEYSEKAIYTHDTKNIQNEWKGFHHGGTLLDLAKRFRDYILKGEQLHPGYIGLDRAWSDGDIWGYGKEALAAVNAEIAGTPVFFKLEEKAA